MAAQVRILQTTFSAYAEEVNSDIALTARPTAVLSVGRPLVVSYPDRSSFLSSGR
jgi:hypothetical protein